MTVSCLFLLVNSSFGYEQAMDPCGRGTFENPNNGGTPFCEDCPTGTFQDKEGQSACEPCLAGTYQPNTRAENCLLCEIGRYQNLEGAERCKECPSGMTTRERGSMSESACVPIDGKLPAMNRWGLILLIGLVLLLATYLLRRSGIFN